MLPLEGWSPSQLSLPSADECAAADEARLSADILSTIVASNAHIIPAFPPSDVRCCFVAKQPARAAALENFVKSAAKMCPKTWPAVLYVVDQASRTGDIPLTETTLRRVVAAATYLVLSTEGLGFAVKLAHMAGVGVPMLGKLADTLASVLGDGGEGWDGVVGMRHVGWIRADLPVLAERVKVVRAQRETLACADDEPMHLALAPPSHFLRATRSASTPHTDAAPPFCRGMSSNTALSTAMDSDAITSFSSTPEGALLAPPPMSV